MFDNPTDAGSDKLKEIGTSKIFKSASIALGWLPFSIPHTAKELKHQGCSVI